MKVFIVLFIMGLGLNGIEARAQTDGAINPVNSLRQELAAMHSLEKWLDLEWLDQLKLYEDYTQMVVDTLVDPKLGIGHVKTFEAFQDQILGMDAGHLFFQIFAAKFWGRDAVATINATQDLLITTYGFDRNAYDHTLMRFLNQIDRQCELLKKYAAPESILSTLDVQSIDRAMAIVKSSTGSRPKAFQAAYPIAMLIKGLDQELSKIPSSSKDLYDAALALRFFNERLIDYGQFDTL